MKLEYRPYSENNILFRISSTKALERFKAQQFFVLSEINSGSYKFSKTSRELAILFTDVMFGWLLSVEHYLIRSDSSVFIEEHKNTILDRLKESILYINNIVSENKDIFDNRESRIVIDNVSLRHEYVERFFKELVGEYIADAFSAIAAILTESIDSFRFELYEVDYLINCKKNPFICITDFMLNIYTQYRYCIAVDRASLYKKVFKVDSFKVKNYSSASVISSQVNCLRDNGIKVTNVMA